MSRFDDFMDEDILTGDSGRKRLGSGIDDQLAVSRAKIEETRKTLLEKNRSGKCRVKFAIDRTYSMQPLIDAVKNNINEIVGRVTQQARCNGSIVWHFAVYCDYCNPEILYETLEPTADSGKIKSWLSTIVADGGGDFEEAVEYVFDQTLQEAKKDPYDCLIIVADAPGHTRAQLDIDGKGQQRTAVEIAKEFGQKKIPVYPLYVDDNSATIQEFAEIAKRSGGISGKMDEQSFLDMIVITILKHAQGASGVEEYVRHNAGMSPLASSYAKKVLLLT